MNVIQKVSGSRPSIVALAEWSLRDEEAYRSNLVVRQSRLVVLDTIGCALAGARSDVAAAVLDYVARFRRRAAMHGDRLASENIVAPCGADQWRARALP